MEEEVKTTKTNIRVRIIESKMGIEPLVVIQVEIIEIIVKETNV